MTSAPGSTGGRGMLKRRWLWLPVAIALLAGVALVPTETRQGVGYTVTSYSLPLYAKTLDFVQRDSSYARLVRRLVTKEQSPEMRALTLFEWTRTNIRDTPGGFPVVDDHVSHIIIRGYGVADQKADVFTTLTAYAGVPAFMAPVPPTATLRLILSFVWVERQWRVFDVEHGIVFRNHRGELASAEELAHDHSLITSVAAGRMYRSKPYESYFEGFQPPVPQDILRPELQMLWPRVSYRLKRLVGLGRREWQGER